MIRLLLSTLPALVATFLIAGQPHAWAQPGYDAATGRSTKRYAPDPQVDYRHLKLDMRMPDPASRSFEATETLTFTTLMLPLERLRLDAVDLEIRRVTDGEGKELEFRYDGQEVVVLFPQPIAPMTEATLVFEYACIEPETGLIFAIPDDEYPDRPLHVHSKGQPEYNRHWLICHDYPNERMTTEIIATVPRNLKVLSNGEFVVEEAAGEGLRRWHYRMNKPHVSYLVSVVIGEFDVVEDEWNGRRVSYWVPPGQAPGVERTFGRTKNMLDFFSDKLGEYPWEAYNQSVVYLFASGGMEHTTATTLHEDSVFTSEKAAAGNSLDGLIAHELAHQWFGDHTTCKSWSHLWLNEGFATYLDSAWHEHYHGRDEYAYEVYTNHRSIARADDVTVAGGLYNPFYDHPSETFRARVSNPYGKGAAVIHMLREYTGDDEVFWNALKLFQARHALSPVEADQLRRCFEDVTGRDYERFFRQWVYRPGTPRFDATYQWNDAAGGAEITLVQTQPIGPEYPAFTGPMEVWAVMSDGSVREFTVDIAGRQTQAQLPTGEEPQQVVINPNNGMLCALSFEPPLAMTLRQATDGPTPFARLQAIDRLAGSRDGRARDILVSILHDAERHWGQRDEAAAALGRMNTDEARDALVAALAAGIDDPRVRRAAVSAVGGYRHESVARALIPFARQDPSLLVEAAACAGLARQDATDAIVELLLEKAEDRGWGHRVRQAAVAALADLGETRGIDPAMELGGYGGPFRARGTGISALGQLYASASEEERQRIREFLVDLTDDPQERHALGAISALGATGDEEALAPLQRVADGSAPEGHRDAAREAIRRINNDDQGAALRSLRRRLDALEQRADAEQAEQAVKAPEAEAEPSSPPATQPATRPAA